MIYSENEILQYVEDNDVKFVKLTFCDISGRLKNISVLSSELASVFEHGVKITANKIEGFSAANGRDLYLFPDAATMTVLPWRPQQGRVIRMFCYIRYKDGTNFVRWQGVSEKGGQECDRQGLLLPLWHIERVLSVSH